MNGMKIAFGFLARLGALRAISRIVRTIPLYSTSRPLDHFRSSFDHPRTCMRHKQAIAATLATFIFSFAAASSAQTIGAETFDSIPPGAPIAGILTGNMLIIGDSIVAAEAPAPCRTDLTGDGVVNGADIAELLARWGTTSIAADFDFSNEVNGADIAALLATWGVCNEDATTVAARFNPSGGFADMPMLQVISEFGLVPDQFGGAIQFIFDYLPADDSTAVFRGGSSGGGVYLSFFEEESVYHMSEFVTGKSVVHDAWATIVFELSRPGKFGEMHHRVLIRDPETVAQFGPEPVEIFPAGPFGPAVHRDTGVPAADPYVPMGALSLDFMHLRLANSIDIGTESPFIDNVRIRRIVPND